MVYTDEEPPMYGGSLFVSSNAIKSGKYFNIDNLNNVLNDIQMPKKRSQNIVFN
jgi:hypothetical protein